MRLPSNAEGWKMRLSRVKCAVMLRMWQFGKEMRLFLRKWDFFSKNAVTANTCQNCRNSYSALGVQKLRKFWWKMWIIYQTRICRIRMGNKAEIWHKWCSNDHLTACLTIYRKSLFLPPKVSKNSQNFDRKCELSIKREYAESVWVMKLKFDENDVQMTI